MKYSEAKIGRAFIIRLEDGDKIPDSIESFAEKNGIRSGMCILVGGIDDRGKIVVGPRHGDRMPPDPMAYVLKGAHEAAAVGTIFPDENNKPKLHMHAAMGRKGKTRTGCVRLGVTVWKMVEIVLIELTGNSARRVKDKATGFEMLQP
ncbi:MAG: DNA-binding protein [Elusimicrobia bacterium RIFOXYB2_FULL_48_7]|nr:MAG: DNA-binding protein [Elusimicrobia bacterium RIFOXYB2_FULL_48_7]